MKRYDEHIIDLIKAHLTGELNADGREALDAWRAEDARNRAFFERVCRDSSIARENAIYAATDAEKAFRRFQARISRRRRTRVRMMWYAAALLLPAAGIALLWPGEPKTEPTAAPAAEIVPGSPRAVLTLADGEQVRLSEEEPQESTRLAAMEVRQSDGALSYKDARRDDESARIEHNTLRTVRGGEYRLELSDGTAVYLNASTTLRYPVAFGKGERRVELDGEAYFEVAKDTARPFIVKARQVDIRVLGTSFDVSTYGGEIVATLVEGKVRMRQGADSVTLLPNQQAVADKHGFAVRQVNARDFTLWREGIFFFENETLETILDHLARWYDVDIFYAEQSVKTSRYSMKVERYKHIDEILRRLAQTNHVRFEIKERTIFVYGKGS